ncbi:MAG: UbiA family prenyltransferase [Bacteriovoracaceae bacterium]|nr:UbiA family prenyltransferase [Bacteriovoracaceae bacterium]
MLKRIFVYLGEMYPPSSWIGTFLSGFMVLTVSWRLQTTTLPFEWMTLLSAMALCLFSLLLRIMDEFKDYQDDLKNFPNRPLPSGKVKHKDLLYLGWFCVLGSLALSAWNLELFLVAHVVLFYSYLMLKWFFVEKQMRASLPLALASHHPIVFVHFIYLLVAVNVTAYGGGFISNFVILPIAFMMTNWEISRKIRSPQDETSYTTYSKIWGPRVAASLSLGLQLIVLFTVINLLNKMNCHVGWSVAFSGLYLFLLFPTVQFLLNLKSKNPLKKFAEAEILSVVLILLAAGWWG